MATIRRGWQDAYTDARLAWLAGTAYPAPGTVYLALYAGSCPRSDGTGGNELATSRVAVTFSAPQGDAHPAYRNVSNTAPVSVAIPSNVTAGTLIAGWGLFTTASGGTPIYVTPLSSGGYVVGSVESPSNVMPGGTLTLPAGFLVVNAEQYM